MKPSGYYVVKMPAAHDCIEADKAATYDLACAVDGDQWRCDCNRLWQRRQGTWVDMTPPPVAKAPPDPGVSEKADRQPRWRRSSPQHNIG